MKQEAAYVCTVKDQEDLKYLQDTLYVISGKWRPQVMLAIYNGNHRYREIAKSIPGITFKMLSKELKEMEMNKLVLREQDPDFPKTVTYNLTEYCASLYPLIQTMVKWAKSHREALK